MFSNSFKWLLQCFVLLFGHFGCHEITSFGSPSMFKLRKTVEKPFNSSRTYHQLSTSKRNIHLPFGRIFKTCLFPGLFNDSGTSRKNLSSINNVNFSYSLYVLSQPIIDSFSRSITYAKHPPWRLVPLKEAFLYQGR